jgi:DNA-binding MarR family transcriptional regulator
MHLSARPNAMPVETAPIRLPCVCARLRRATRALTQLYDDVMAPSGLRVTQFSLLRTLARRGTSRMSDLAATLLLDRTALSRTVDPLAERGLVTIASGRDARTREIALTRDGARALRRAEPHWQRAQAQVADRLDATRLDALFATLAEVEALHPSPGARATRHPPSPRGPARAARRAADRAARSPDEPEESPCR